MTVFKRMGFYLEIKTQALQKAGIGKERSRRAVEVRVWIRLLAAGVLFRRRKAQISVPTVTSPSQISDLGDFPVAWGGSLKAGIRLSCH